MGGGPRGVPIWSGEPPESTRELPFGKRISPNGGPLSTEYSTVPILEEAIPNKDSLIGVNT